MYKQIIRCIREYKWDVILTPFFLGCEVLVDTFIPLVMAKLIDNGIKQGNLRYTILSGLIMIGLATLGMAFGALSGVFFPPERPPASARTCGTTFTTRFRTFPSPTSISSAPVAL